MRWIEHGPVALLALLALLARTASADDGTDADAMFAKAVELKQQGKTAEACQLFEDALHKNNAAVGLLLNVALCKANEGKTASAEKLFADARDRAAEQKLDEHHKAAIEQLAKLEGHVPHLVITFAEPPGVETRVVVDNEAVPTSGEKIPVDPGKREVLVTAPGRMPFRTTVDVAPGGEDLTVAVPRLATAMTTKQTRKLVGELVVVGGGVGFAASVGLALYAHHKYSAQFDNGNCHEMAGDYLCNGDGYRATGRAKTLARTATYVGAVSIAATALGAYLWVTGRKESADRVTVVPDVDGNHAGIAAIGTF